MKQSLSAAALWAAAIFLAAPGPGHAQSMEERLRTQLRSTTQQLQQLQSERAQIDVARRSAETERDAANKESSALRAEVDALRQRAAHLEDGQDAVRRQAQAQAAGSREQARKAESAYQTLQAQAAALHSEATALKAGLAERDNAYRQCVAKNEDMYSAGRELLAAYEAFGTGGLLTVRQPFAGRARVLFDESAQAFGDRLYQSQVDAGMPPGNGAGQ